MANARKIKGSLTGLGLVMFAGGFLELELRGKTTRHLLTKVSHTLDSNSWQVKAEFE
ncbi:hypothetical protein [Helicobacter sp. 13S00401-1]|uniref:hypothetical protein n=1 Tax=Helicobacter sp. 13S00401-1 TaxID=1905758 RepID=UPI001554F890|nr:hypothetical protein [Helicobacter sp. 13S00401-1]